MDCTDSNETMHLMDDDDDDNNMELKKKKKCCQEFTSVYEVCSPKNVTLTQSFFVLVGYNIGERFFILRIVFFSFFFFFWGGSDLTISDRTYEVVHDFFNLICDVVVNIFDQFCDRVLNFFEQICDGVTTFIDPKNKSPRPRILINIGHSPNFFRYWHPHPPLHSSTDGFSRVVVHLKCSVPFTIHVLLHHEKRYANGYGRERRCRYQVCSFYKNLFIRASRLKIA